MKLFTLKRFFVVTLLVCLGIGQSRATGGNHTKHFGRMTVATTDAATGRVYLSKSNVVPADVNEYKDSMSETWDCDENSSGDTNPFYLFAKSITPGYAFLNWGSNNRTANPYKPTDKATGESEDKRSEYTYKANFAKLHRYTASIEVKAVWDENESDEVEGTVEVIGDSEQSYPVATTSNIYDYDGNQWVAGNGDPYTTSTSNQSFTFTVKATVSSPNKYQFVGWTEDEVSATPTNPEQANSHTVRVTSTTATGEHVHPASKVVYAHFKKINYSKATVKVTNSEAGTVYVSASNEQYGGAYETLSTATQESTGKEHTYYRWAKANIGYKFVGWCESEDLSDTPLTQSSFKFDVTASTPDVPTSKTYYAKFERTSTSSYLRNRATGRFLKIAGSNPTVGNYPLAFDEVKNNTSSLHCQAGYVNVSDNTLSISNTATNWTISDMIDGKFVTISNNGMALCGNTALDNSLKDNPNYGTVVVAGLDATKKEQQWEILTEPELGKEIYDANLQNPINASWLLDNPNFDTEATDAWTSTTQETGRYQSVRVSGTEKDFNVAEIFIQTCNDRTCRHDTRYDIYQTINNIPNGFYLISCQALQRTDYHNFDVDSNIVLYGTSANNTNNERIATISSLYDESVKEGQNGHKYDENQEEWKNEVTPENGYWYPNSMEVASEYFTKGYYKNYVVVNVTDGTLKLGIKKTSSTDKSHSVWTCFDNFQLYYLGTEQPASDYDVENLDTRRAVKLSNDKKTLELTGLWRVLDEQELVDKMNEIEGTGDDKAEKSPLVIDATNATLIAKPELPATANKNTIIKVKDASKVVNSQNVIDAENKCAELELTDQYNFAKSELVNITTGKTTINRTLKAGVWNTFCVPFAMSASDIAAGAKVQKLASAVPNENNGYTLSFEETKTLEAGVPYVVKVSSEVKSFSKSNAKVDASGKLTKEAGYDVKFVGNYDATTAPEGSYIISNNQFYFVNSEVALKGFRGYFEIPGPIGALSASFEDEATGITTVNVNDNDDDNYYNVAGQRVNASTKGIIIKNGRKFINK